MPEILQPEFLGGFGHFFECIVTVARNRMAMKRAAQIFLLDQFRQRVLFGRFEFAAVLSQLRRNEIEIDRAIQIGFIAHLWNFLQRSFLFRFRINWNRSEPVFVERPASLQRAAAHLDVVFLVPGEISKRKRVFRRRDHSQIALHSRTQSHARFGRTLRDDRIQPADGKRKISSSPPARLSPPANRDRARFLFAADNSRQHQPARPTRARPDRHASIPLQLRPGRIEMNRRALRVSRWRHKFFAGLFRQSRPIQRRAPLRTPFATARSN